MPPLRPDETYHRLLFWTYGQTLSERLAGHLLAGEGYTEVDPSHPLGGRDQGADALCLKNGRQWVMASYFPYGQHDYADIEDKLLKDIKAGRHRQPHGFAFVCNQKITNGERTRLLKAAKKAAKEFEIDIFHLERNVHILDRPEMGQVREQYVYIPATGLPPMAVKASVRGSAHAFTGDADLLDAFVWAVESQIRERSDAGHARIRQEQETKERAEQERLARQAREARDRALPPWHAGAGVDMNAMLDRSGLLDSLKFNMPTFELPDRSSRLVGGMGAPPKPKPPEPLSEQQIEEKVARYRSEMHGRWPACKDYLAAVAWPALRLSIANDAESFLTDFQVILTFHGARAVRFEGLAAYRFEKVQDPSWEPVGDPRFSNVLPAAPARLARPSDYPIEGRHNGDGDLEVTVTLPQLRPHPEWRSDNHGDDIVLVVDPEETADTITVTYTATAQGYGTTFYGDPFAVPVERVEMRDVLAATDAAAAKEAS